MRSACPWCSRRLLPTYCLKNVKTGPEPSLRRSGIRRTDPGKLLLVQNTFCEPLCGLLKGGRSPDLRLSCRLPLLSTRCSDRLGSLRSPPMCLPEPDSTLVSSASPAAPPPRDRLTVPSSSSYSSPCVRASPSRLAVAPAAAVSSPPRSRIPKKKYALQLLPLLRLLFPTSFSHLVSLYPMSYALSSSFLSSASSSVFLSMGPFTYFSI